MTIFPYKRIEVEFSVTWVTYHQELFCQQFDKFFDDYQEYYEIRAGIRDSCIVLNATLKGEGYQR